MMGPQLGDDAKRVLRAVAERDMDGYTLARQTRLDGAQLEAAVRELTSNELLRVKGEATGDRLFEAWFQAAPGAMRFLGSSAY